MDSPCCSVKYTDTARRLVRTLPAEAGGEAHATSSHGLGHFGGAPRVGIWFSTCLSNLFCIGSCNVVLRYLPQPHRCHLYVFQFLLHTLPSFDRATVSNKHFESCLFCHAMHCVLTCNCIELLGMKVYVCIHMFFQSWHQVLQIYKIASPHMTASAAERRR